MSKIIEMLYDATVAAPLGLSILIQIGEVNPSSAPVTGAAWPADIDHVICELHVTLPGLMGQAGHAYDEESTGEGILHALRSDTIALLGERLVRRWGSGPIANGDRQRIVRRSGASRRSLVQELRELAEKELLPLLAHLAARAARLAERDRALEFARSH